MMDKLVKPVVLIFTLVIFLVTPFSVRSSDLNKTQPQSSDKKVQELKVFYTYRDREHSFKEDLTHLGSIYALEWAVYYLTQTDTFNNHGSWRNYRRNYGRLVWDKDETYWNWVAHPYIGSQLYLFYRANGYSQIRSLEMAFYQSTLFETMIEIYTEPASIEDLYQTPILGATLGFLLENISLKLINGENPLGRVVGHILNPFTLFWFNEGKVSIIPEITPKRIGFNFHVNF